MTTAEDTGSPPQGTRLSRRLFGVLAVFFVVLALAVLAAGEPSFLIAVAVLAVIVFGYATANHLLTRRVIARDGSLDDAMSDETDPIPSTPLIPDGETPLGDTPEAHDEITPHDLPIGHPGRQAAEEQAGGEEGTTRGHADPSEAPPDGTRS